LYSEHAIPTVAPVEYVLETLQASYGRLRAEVELSVFGSADVT
jgi:hypothetical protein